MLNMYYVKRGQRLTTRANPVMTTEERLAYCIARRKDLERELKDAELMIAIIKQHVAQADRIIDDIKVMMET